MAETFTCPSCSAPLEYEGGAMQKCKFCGSSVLAPSGLYKLSDILSEEHHAPHQSDFEIGGFSGLINRTANILEIQKLINEGNKPEAVKVFHKSFGGTLDEATKAVDAFARGEAVNLSGIQVFGASTPGGKPRVVVKGGWLARAIVILVVLAPFLVIGAVVLPQILRSVGVNGVLGFFAYPLKEVMRIGGEGNGQGKFEDNRAIAIDGEGNIFSADYSGGRIQMFDSAGNFKKMISLDRKATIKELVADRSGNIYVIAQSKIRKINAATGTEIAAYDSSWAQSIARGLDGKIYFTTHEGVEVLSENLTPLSKIKFPEDLNIGFTDALAVDGAGNLYIDGPSDGGILKLSPSGTLLNRIGAVSKKSSSGLSDKLPSELNSSIDAIAIDPQGRIFVSTFGRIAAFDADGKFLFEYKLNMAEGLVFDDKGDLYVAERPYIAKYKVEKTK